MSFSFVEGSLVDASGCVMAGGGGVDNSLAPNNSPR